jgi:hypothetical protein
MYAPPIMTSSQARETLDRLSEETVALRRYGIATAAWIADYNEALSAFVPRDKMPLFYIGKSHYTGDTARPGAFVQGGLFRQLIKRARRDFDSLLVEERQQAPSRSRTASIEAGM